jgi:hypothetical protein
MRLPRFKFNGSLLIWLSGLMMGGFLVSASMDIWRYLRLEERVPASVEKWKIIEKSSSQFALRASYTFEYQGKVHQGKTTFSKPYHLNRPSAVKQIHSLNQKPWTVWVHPGYPDHSSLEKNFPLKKSLYSLMTLAIYFYFIYLRLRYALSINS